MSPRWWSWEDFCKLAVAFGFEMDPPTGGGSHYIIHRESLSFTVARPHGSRNEVSPRSIKALREFIEDAIHAEESGRDSD